MKNTFHRVMNDNAFPGARLTRTLEHQFSLC
uniref:Uncharacterized protein n=1 Tax=Rhizophora mucronata TaxID=61149 RepID=A0A2P2J235_RHIMU